MIPRINADPVTDFPWPADIPASPDAQILYEYAVRNASGELSPPMSRKDALHVVKTCMYASVVRRPYLMIILGDWETVQPAKADPEISQEVDEEAAGDNPEADAA